MAFEKQMEELSKKRKHALEMGGAEKIKKVHDSGKYTARERIDKVLDTGTFLETGMFNHSDVPGMEEITPADSKIAGFGKIDGRHVGIVANDFTVLGATSSRVAGRKEGDVKLASMRGGFPMIYLGESGGARMPDIMGSKGLASVGGGGFDTFTQMMSRVRQNPFITAVLGKCYGMPTWMACLSDFVIQVKGSAMAVSGPRVLKLAQNETITDDELGGWKLHGEITGMADRIADNEEECFELIKTFLSYMPSNNEELPPVAPVPEGSGEDMGRILDFLPEKRNRTYNMHQIIKCIIDRDSFYPIKPMFGKSVITGLARAGGRVIGIIANQPAFSAGAMDTDAIDKVISFLCLCDSFNIPVTFFHDIPGFLVGKKAEINRVGARVMNYINALGQMTVPRISIIVRKTYGMAFWNMSGSGTGADSLVAWPTAEMSFVDPEIAANVVHGGKIPESEREKKEWDDLVRQMVDETSPFGAAGLNYINDVIDPGDTREHIIKTLERCQETRTKGIGKHRLANWPTKF